MVLFICAVARICLTTAIVLAKAHLTHRVEYTIDAVTYELQHIAKIVLVLKRVTVHKVFTHEVKELQLSHLGPSERHR